jgi:cytosine/adenosine deaminase-related metal-dependent hydrolase
VDAEFLSLAKRNKAIYIPTLFVTDGYALVRYNSWQPTEAERRLADPQILAQMNELERARKDQLPATMLPLIRQSISFRPGVTTIGMDNIRPVWDAGIPVALGTDAGNIGTLHGPSIFREMQLMVESGLKMSEVLASATVNGAKTMGMEKDLGSIERGKLADLVVLNADPLGKVDNLSRIHRVLKGGKVYDTAELMSSIK